MKQRNISEINEWRACAGACGDIGVGLLRGFLQTQCRIRARIKHRFIQVHIRAGGRVRLVSFVLVKRIGNEWRACVVTVEWC